MYKDILFEWNPWWGKYTENSLEREDTNKIYELLQLKEILFITGIRRSGKTTILYQLISKLIDNKINPMDILFIKVDDLRLKELTYKKIDEIIQEYKTLKETKSITYIFLDEIQELPDWEQYIKTIYDLNKDLKIIISGSNSGLLKKNINSYLTGRIISKEVYPFSFKEFLKYYQINIINIKDIYINKIPISKKYRDYIKTGGFPEVIKTKDNLKNEVLKNYFDTILYRDITEKYKVRNTIELKDFLIFILSNNTRQVNYVDLAKEVGLSRDTISNYVSYLSECYLLFLINKYSYSYKSQIKSAKKIYPVDLGLINAVSFKFSEDLGRAYENLVFIELKRRNKEIYYYKNIKNQECDFIIKQGLNIVEAIQVTYDLTKIKTKEREINGLLSALDEFKLKEGIIITDNQEKEEIIDGKKIRYVPIINWLLS
ncbi:MAG: ATP-binding protein [archaeon]|jgi:hypothetical protein